MNDAPLHDLFGRARGHETANAPDFDRLLTSHHRVNVAGPSIGLALLAAAAVATFSVSEPPPPAMSLTEWRSPTAFLMRTTDEALWRDLPSLGASMHFPQSDQEIP